MSPTDEDVREYLTKLSNWGRWGAEDQRGTLNLLTDESRRRAVTAVRHGRAVGCARTLSPRHSADNPEPILHHMTLSGENAPETGFGAATDWFGMSFHGYAITHLDALSHLFWDGQMYNGRPASLVKTASGARAGSVELAGDGIVARGVLLDIPRHRGVPWLELGEAIGPDELVACAREQNVEIGSGDVLLVRIGRDPRRADRGPSEPVTDGTPGLNAATLPLLREWDIALLGSDGTNDVMPSGYADFQTPVHSVGIVAMGLWLLDNAQLEPLAAACAELSQWDFLFMASPLLIKNSTGSPVSPVAVL